MSPEDKKKFIEDHLYHELCSLLEAAAFWQVLKDSRAGCEISLVMESAFVHARTLFVFFAATEGNKENANSMRMTDFGLTMYKSPIYSTTKEALNRHIFHLNKNRLKPTNQKNSGHINEKVKIFADEILRLWEMFEEEDGLGELGSIAKAARLRALDDAHNTLEGRVASILRNAQAPQSESSVRPKESNQFVS